MRLLGLVILILVLTACAETTPMTGAPIQVSKSVETQLRSASETALFDPFSAEYRDLRAYRLENGETAICGRVNAKNRFGAFIGFQPFYTRYRPAGSGAAMQRFVSGAMANGVCRALASGQSIPVTTG